MTVKSELFEVVTVPAPAEIQATSSVFQCLAEAFKCNTKASVPSGQSVLEYLKEFNSVFSKESFDALPESKKWDLLWTITDEREHESFYLTQVTPNQFLSWICQSSDNVLPDSIPHFA